MGRLRRKFGIYSGDSVLIRPLMTKVRLAQRGAPVPVLQGA